MRTGICASTSCITCFLRPSLPARSAVRVIRSGCVAFAVPGESVIGLIGSARVDLATGRREAQPARSEVGTPGAVPPVVPEVVGLRHFLGAAEKIGPRFVIAAAPVQYLGNDLRVGFPNMGQPSPNGGFLDFLENAIGATAITADRRP